jgi:serine/threonine-protein kinase
MIVGRERVGRYEIERHVASGGMAEVYLARDGLSGERVALKIPHDGDEIWDAERTGAALQIELSNRDSRVPRVHEIGDGAERFVAMEYVEGEDLSRRLSAGPLDWREAAAIAAELCGVLATARSCCASDGEPGGVVHGDIKPRNIRLQEGGRIKVLDFGIAKALRQTRSETRNLYGSVPYSSPERLDRGHVDYHSDLWAVAVVLYEMLEGRRPFRAPSDAELERAIRSGERPTPLEREVPAEFQAMIDKAFARELRDRYASAQELESDLRSVLLGQSIATRRTVQTHGMADVDATRRTLGPVAADADATRRTVSGNGSAAAPRPQAFAQATESVGASESVPASAPEARKKPARPAAWTAWLPGRRWKGLVLVAVGILAAREIQALGTAGEIRASLAARPRGEAGAVWTEYRRVMRGHLLAHLSGLDGAVRDWMLSHADDLISRYRSDTPTLYETGWRSAEALLQRAITIDPGNRRIQARLEFCRAHLLRISARDAQPVEESMSRYDEAVSRFERASRLWPQWADPHIGLAQIYAYGKRDPERTAAELERARDAHYPFGERETALLADAYMLRAERRWAGSTEAFDADQQYRHLERVRDDCVHALDQYELVPSYPGVARHLRALRQRLAEIDERERALAGGPWLELSPLPGSGR